ncbi:MAG TPA: type VI secretion system ATPase TssH [Longimicrobiales bacterium]|nr:type VI secretion system ATPase TssH [Longimicrobiales bacterium]
MNVNVRSLIGKLNNETRNAVESAAGLCLSRTHYDVEIEHYLVKLLDSPDGDLTFILKHYGIDRSRVARELTASLDALKTGNARTPSLSPSLVKMLTTAWTLGSVEFDASRIRTGHTILALAADEDLKRMLPQISKELLKVNPEDLRKELAAIVGGSAEEAGAARGPSAAGTEAPARSGKTPNLSQYTVDLTERARQGTIDPVLGRDFEIRQVVDILTRRRQNNPILVGEAGVGKTAVVEGFAMRIVNGDVPPVLRQVTLRSLDLALLQAGAGVKGEFENRLKGLIEEVKSSPTPIILFIDEAHTMIGAGGAAGQGDAANLLKPALARGELRTLAATTWSEYKKYFEKDPALTRRFQLVKVEEPSEDLCLVMMRAVVPYLERHHNVRILDDGVDAAVRLSHRYLADRQLPDKAVSVLDTACARLALGQNATPAPIEDARRTLDDLAVQARVLERETAAGADHRERLETITAAREATEARLADLDGRWERERDLVGRVRELRQRLEDGVGSDPAATGVAGNGRPAADEDAAPADATGEGGAAEPAADTADQPPVADPAALREELGELVRQLDELQGDEPLVPVTVDGGLIGQVISGWTGIPVGKMHRDDLSTALTLEDHLQRRIIGQDHALEVISHRIRTSRAGIEDPQKPKGVFLLVGPSGVGKTETALTLSDLLYGGEHNLITIAMSEFQEAHTVSTLKGSPPGYVGYGEGGVLTEAVRRRPYSVVLLDEIEKAHPDVLELFYQVFDKGRMEDGEGRQIDFKNTVIVLTSNAGTETIMAMTADPETTPDQQGLVKALKPELDKIFKPAFLGRTVIIPFFPVRDEALKQIVRLKVGKIRRRLHDAHRVDFALDDRVIDEIANRCTEVESGARNVDNILSNTMLPDISRVLLRALVDDIRLSGIDVGLGDDGNFTYTVRTADGSARVSGVQPLVPA